MSVIRKKPFIESVLDTLTTSELSALKYVMNNGGNNVSVSLVSGSFEKGEGKIITSTITPVYLEVESNKFYSAILIWNASYCVAIPYHRFQDVKLIKINPSTRTYEEIKEYCDINELRRIIDDTAESSFDADGEAGQVLTADGEGGVQWKDNPQIIALTTNSGTLTSDQVALASAGNTVITLSGEYYYRFSKSDSAIVFKATPRVDNDTTYIDNITIDLSDNTYSASYETIAAGEGFTPTYDDELSDSSTNAVQNKVINAALAEKADVADLEDYAKKDGNYPTMSVGHADSSTSLDTELGVNDETPFAYQTAGGESDITTGIQSLEKLVGCKIAKNQLMPKTTTATISGEGESGITASVDSDGYVTISGTALRDVRVVFNGNSLSIPANHVGLCWVIGNMSGCRVERTGFVSLRESKYCLLRYNQEWNIETRIFVPEGSTVVAKIKPLCSDITLRYGNNDVVTAILGSLPSNGNQAPESMVEDLIAFDPNIINDIPYNTGTFTNCKSAKLKNVDYNLWDEQSELGSINQYGELTPTNEAIRSKNPIPCLGGKEYYIVDASAYVVITFYDKNNNKVDYTGYGAYQNCYNGGSHTFTAPLGASYMRFRCSISYGTTYKNDICIFLYWDGSRIGYEPYSEHIYTLPNKDLNGLLKVVDGKVVADGDELYPNGEGNSKKYTVVDLSTLNWTLLSNFWTTSDLLLLTKTPSGASVLPNIISEKYSTITSSAFDGGANGITIYYSDGKLIARTGNTTNSPTGTLCYELVTPESITADSFPKNIYVDDFGTMQFLDENDNQIEGLQGCEVFYKANVSGFAESVYAKTEGDPDDLVVQEDLVGYVKQVDLSSSVIAGENVTINSCYLIKNGRVCTITFKVTLSDAISAGGTLVNIPSSARPSTQGSVSSVGFVTGGTTPIRISLETNGNIVTNNDVASGEFVKVTMSYCLD